MKIQLCRTEDISDRFLSKLLPESYHTFWKYRDHTIVFGWCPKIALKVFWIGIIERISSHSHKHFIYRIKSSYFHDSWTCIILKIGRLEKWTQKSRKMRRSPVSHTQSKNWKNYNSGYILAYKFFYSILHVLCRNSRIMWFQFKVKCSLKIINICFCITNELSRPTFLVHHSTWFKTIDQSLLNDSYTFFIFMHNSNMSWGALWTLNRIIFHYLGYFFSKYFHRNISEHFLFSRNFPTIITLDKFSWSISPHILCESMNIMEIFIGKLIGISYFDETIFHKK